MALGDMGDTFLGENKVVPVLTCIPNLTCARRDLGFPGLLPEVVFQSVLHCVNVCLLPLELVTRRASFRAWGVRDLARQHVLDRS